jgi:hypothetical protein
MFLVIMGAGCGLSVFGILAGSAMTIERLALSGPIVFAFLVVGFRTCLTCPDITTAHVLSRCIRIF